MVIKYRIKERSLLARIAAFKLKTDSVAMVIGKTIHLHNVSRHEFISNERWLRHEQCHLHQYHRHGTLSFLARYLWESARRGYYNNKYEAEARRAEDC